MLKLKTDILLDQSHREQMLFSNTPDHQVPGYRYSDSSIASVVGGTAGGSAEGEK